MEVANGFCELNDPDEQAENVPRPGGRAHEGDDEAMLYDEDYVEALAYGMPPTAGRASASTASRCLHELALHPRRDPLPADGGRRRGERERQKMLRQG